MQPDIEIYCKEASLVQLHAWLKSVFEACTEWEKIGQTQRCYCDAVPVILFERAVGSWHCLLFDSPLAPWATDLECAEAACAALGVEVRCAPGGWQEEQGEAVADDWLSVTGEGVKQITWRTK